MVGPKSTVNDRTYMLRLKSRLPKLSDVDFLYLSKNVWEDVTLDVPSRDYFEHNALKSEIP